MPVKQDHYPPTQDTMQNQDLNTSLEGDFGILFHFIFKLNKSKINSLN